jgi:hypothetical protein
MEEVPRFKVWQCVGCGRIEDPQPCVGICRDVKAEFVPAAAHDEAMAQAQAATEALRAVVLRIASVTPRPGECERTWSALQAEARRVLSLYPSR